MVLQTSIDVSDYVNDLVAAATLLSGVDSEKVSNLSRILLALPEKGSSRNGIRSALNYDESPLQLCLVAHSGGYWSRLIADPAVVIDDPAERYGRSLNALEQTLQCSLSTGLKPLCDRSLRHYIPDDPGSLAEFPDGMIWLGAGIDTPGCALYIDARRGGPAVAWDQAEKWVTGVLAEPSEAVSSIQTLRNGNRLMSIGIEGTDPTNARAKLYWRLDEPRHLDQMGITRLNDPALKHFVSLLIGTKRIRLTGIVLSLGFLCATGSLFDVKIDVCCCHNCLSYTPGEWSDLLNICSEAYQLAEFPVSDILREHRCEAAFAGISADITGKYRLFLYMKAAPQTYGN